MRNSYINEPKDKWEIRWYLIEGGILESIDYGSYESFRKKTWDVLVALTSKNNIEEIKKSCFLEHLDNVILMIKGCHYFLHHKKRLNFEEDWIDIKWLENPYRCLERYRASVDEKLNHHLAHFDYKFTQLDRAEIQNFVSAFENFFSNMDLSSWLNLLDDWKVCINSNNNIYDSWGEYAPLKTFEYILKLREACYVAYHWASYDYPPPNKHVIVDYLGTDYVNGYETASPYEMANDIFKDQSYLGIRQSIFSLFPECSCKQENISMSGLDLRYTLKLLLQTGWSFLQTDFFPGGWLDPDKIDCLRCPVPEANIANWQPKSLSNKEQKNLQKTLSKLYHRIDVLEEIFMVDSRIIEFFESRSSGEVLVLNSDNIKTKNLLLKTLDILTLIVLDFRERRMKNEGIFYPSSLNIIKEINKENFESENQ